MDEQAVLKELKVRLQMDGVSEEAAFSMIEAARLRLLEYCNIPLSARVPEGLFEAWCSLAAQMITDGYCGSAVSVSEGDVAVKFGDSGDMPHCCRYAANRHRRMNI